MGFGVGWSEWSAGFQGWSARCAGLQTLVIPKMVAKDAEADDT